MSFLAAALVLLMQAGLGQTQDELSMAEYAMMEAPSNASIGAVKFLFFNPSNLGEAPTSVRYPRDLKSNFDPSLETVVIIHGFADYYPGSYLIPALIKGYSTYGKKNLIALEWGELAAAPWYLTAARNTYRVGKRLAEFLSIMMEEKKLSMSKLEIVGFSLGAHVAGVASSMLTSPPRRIIGLDPAELLFVDSPPEYILDKSDAPLVEVVHTSGGYIGFKRPLGHRDFYPNGGEHPQPGCEGELVGTCSHRRAYHYFAEALMKKGRGFKATLCPSFQDYRTQLCQNAPKLRMVNNNFDPKLKGLFFLETNRKKPYARKES